MTEPDAVALQVARYEGALDEIEGMLDASFLLDDGIQTEDIIDRLHEFQEEFATYFRFVQITSPEEVRGLDDTRLVQLEQLIEERRNDG